MSCRTRRICLLTLALCSCVEVDCFNPLVLAVTCWATREDGSGCRPRNQLNQRLALSQAVLLWGLANAGVTVGWIISAIRRLARNGDVCTTTRHAFGDEALKP